MRDDYLSKICASYWLSQVGGIRFHLLRCLLSRSATVVVATEFGAADRLIVKPGRAHVPIQIGFAHYTEHDAIS